MSEQSANVKRSPLRKERPGPFYKVKMEGLQDAGITAKQFRHWRENGLFSPEMGDGSRYLTEKDIEFLGFLRRLIVDFGFPIAIVKRLVDQMPRLNRRQMLFGNPSDYRFFDLKHGKLVRTSQALELLQEELTSDFAPNAYNRQAEEWLLTIATYVFACLASEHGSSVVYQAARDSLLARIKRMDLVARVDQTTTEDGDIDYWLWPSLKEDPQLDSSQMETLFKEHQRRLKGYLGL